MTRLVVDLGCVGHGGEESIEKLIARFRPDLFFGFDPLLSKDSETLIDGSRCVFEKKAAWYMDDNLLFALATSATTVVRAIERPEWSEPRACKGFAFSSWLARIAPGFDEVIVKMDIEGSEFAVLKSMIANGTDKLVTLLLIEWHDHLMGGNFTEARELLLEELLCPVEAWK